MRPRGKTLAFLALLALLAAAAAVLIAVRPGKKAPRGPQNVVVILLDTLRADHLSLYGYARPTSPQLAAFAARSQFFTDGRSQASCTFPSANSLLTSRHPFRFLGQAGGRIGIPREQRSIAEILGDNGYRTVAVSASPVVRKTPSHHNRYGGFERGFETFDEDCLMKRAACVNRKAARYLDELQGGREPFFLYLHYMDPHSAYDPPKGFRDRFTDPAPGLPPWVLRGNPLPIRRSLYGDGPKIDVAPREIAYLVGLYDEEIAYLDEQLGRLFADLERRGLLENSIVAVAGDHGEEFLEHDNILHCRTVYDTLNRTPLILHLPAVERPARLGGLAQNLDLVPTILDYLGLDPLGPAGGGALEGRSLRPLIEAGKPVNAHAFALQHTSRSVTDGRFKLIWDMAADRYELYDLAADPGEERDVLARERRAFHRLRGVLLAWLKQVEGGARTSRSLEAAEESRKELEALGYLQ